MTVQPVNQMNGLAGIEEARPPSDNKWEKRNRSKTYTIRDRIRTVIYICLVMVPVLVVIFKLRVYTSSVVSPMRQIQCSQMIG